MLAVERIYLMGNISGKEIGKTIEIIQNWDDKDANQAANNRIRQEQTNVRNNLEEEFYRK